MINKCFLIGRIVRDPDIRSTAGAQPMTIARYTLAVDRREKRSRRISSRAWHSARMVSLRRSI